MFWWGFYCEFIGERSPPPDLPEGGVYQQMTAARCFESLPTRHAETTCQMHSMVSDHIALGEAFCVGKTATCYPLTLPPLFPNLPRELAPLIMANCMRIHPIWHQCPRQFISWWTSSPFTPAPGNRLKKRKTTTTYLPFPLSHPKPPQQFNAFFDRLLHGSIPNIALFSSPINPLRKSDVVAFFRWTQRHNNLETRMQDTMIRERSQCDDLTVDRESWWIHWLIDDSMCSPAWEVHMSMYTRRISKWKRYTVTGCGGTTQLTRWLHISSVCLFYFKYVDQSAEASTSIRSILPSVSQPNSPYVALHRSSFRHRICVVHPSGRRICIWII